MSNYVRFEQNGRTLYGTVFGYAVEYSITNGHGGETVRFAEKLVMAEDPQNCKMPMPIDIVSECIFELAKEKKQVRAILYGRLVIFGKDENLFDIKKRIREIQKSLIKIDSSVAADVKQFIDNGIFDLIRWMPVH